MLPYREAEENLLRAVGEKRHLFTAQILRLQLIQKAVPVVLQFACAPRRRTQHEQVVFLHFAGRRIGHIVYIAPLQAKGIKVIMGNLGDHTGAGFANLPQHKSVLTMATLAPSKLRPASLSILSAK